MTLESWDNRVNSSRSRRVLHHQEFLLLDGDDILPLLSSCLSLQQAPLELAPFLAARVPHQEDLWPFWCAGLITCLLTLYTLPQEVESNSLPLEYELSCCLTSTAGNAM